ncbi:MAG: magnesium transporter [Clostridia bacterium]|nr:magnesium transporter [Clostridia bacterium]
MSDEILELIAEKKYTRLRTLLSEINPADIAEIFDEADKKDIPIIFRILPKELAAEVFTYLESDRQQLLIEALSDKELRDVMDELFMDDTVDIIEEMPANVAKRILKQTDASTRKMINKLLAYPEDSAGSIMTTEYIDLKKDMTVDEAFDRIRLLGVETESIFTCYVIDKKRSLSGVVTVKDLLLSKKDTIIENIMDENIIFANTFDDKEEVANQFTKYDLFMLPVVDKENRLVGIVTVDDAIDVIEEEATEDMEIMAAILPTEKTYFKSGVFETFKSRIPWLLLLMISATFTGAIISSYEAKLTLFPALIAFMPMLMNTAGNAGSQSSVTVIRGLSLGDIEFKNIFKVIWKEIRVGFLCSIALSIVNFAKMWFIDYKWLNNFDSGHQILEIVIVCAALLLTVIIAKIIGGVLPILAKKIGFDPAVMASPFITTLVDAIALMIYFNFATMLLNI